MKIIAHIVTCPICNKKFDRDKIAFIQVSSRRYAHEECAKDIEKNQSKEEKEKQALENYIMQLFKIDYILPRMRKQIKEYVENYHYSYSGMHRTLQYFYEIKHNNIEKANQSLGIIPYVYAEAYKYYFAIWQAQMKNSNKSINKENYQEVRIRAPQRRSPRKRKFKFLDEEYID